jgi:Eukaryotic-type carbonic anhydrase
VPPRQLRSEDDEFLDSSNSTEAANDNWNRDLQVRFEWNPYHISLIPTLYFFRYDGSITEPPCAEMVSWFVSDKPMIVSFEQLERLKNIQFTNVDATCHMTSVGFEGSVARPIQPTNGRTVWRCTEKNFLADPR